MMVRWLCPLSVAPYAIDPLDNPAFYAGRPSPPALTAGADHLVRGQVFMTMFRLADFETDRHITLRSHRFSSLFGDVGVTYLVLPRQEGSRAVVKLVGAFKGYPVARLLAPPLAWVDLTMMQCQLRRLRRYAERDDRRSARVSQRRHAPASAQTTQSGCVNRRSVRAQSRSRSVSRGRSAA